jgi:ADP-ribosylglycohydrolase/protein-tyrosine phosphatase
MMLEPLRLSGGVWGHLVGDAMGVPYEFRQPEQIGTAEWGATGTHGQPPGTWSDDGALMLALLDALLPDTHSDPPRPGGFDLQRQAENFVRWQRHGAFTPDGTVFDIGSATRRALARLEKGTPPERSGGGEDALGNGSLMRTVAIALAGRELGVAELVDQAERSSAITHAATLATVTCALYALVCQRLLKGQEPGEALAGAQVDLRALCRDHGAEGKAQALDQVLGWEKREGRGHVVDSFWSAWDAFSSGSGYADVIERAIRYGHDTDTTACIAGGMAGIYWGIEGIPNEWLSGMRGREVAGPIVDRLVESAGWKTSASDPLRVNWIDPEAVPPESGWTGKLGMTFLPGKKDAAKWGLRWRDTVADAAALAAAGASTFLLLVEDFELDLLRTPKLPAALDEAGVELIRFRIVDGDVPVDLAAFRELLTDVERRIQGGKNVVVACRGGLGRTGTTVACLLIGAGLSADDAVALTRRTRRGTIENERQLDFVRAWSSGSGG